MLSAFAPPSTSTAPNAVPDVSIHPRTLPMWSSKPKLPDESIDDFSLLPPDQFHYSPRPEQQQQYSQLETATDAAELSVPSQSFDADERKTRMMYRPVGELQQAASHLAMDNQQQQQQQAYFQQQQQQYHPALPPQQQQQQPPAPSIAMVNIAPSQLIPPPSSAPTTTTTAKIQSFFQFRIRAPPPPPPPDENEELVKAAFEKERQRLAEEEKAQKLSQQHAAAVSEWFDEDTSVYNKNTSLYPDQIPPPPETGNPSKIYVEDDPASIGVWNAWEIENIAGKDKAAPSVIRKPAFAEREIIAAKFAVTGISSDVLRDIKTTLKREDEETAERIKKAMNAKGGEIRHGAFALM